MSKQGSHWYRLASIGPHFLVCTLMGFAAGKYWFDAWFDSYPVCTVIFSLFGIAAGFLNLFREVALLNKIEEEEARRQAEGEDVGDDDANTKS